MRTAGVEHFLLEAKGTRPNILGLPSPCTVLHLGGRDIGDDHRDGDHVLLACLLQGIPILLGLWVFGAISGPSVHYITGSERIVIMTSVTIYCALFQYVIYFSE